jgi:hypothetical protein
MNTRSPLATATSFFSMFSLPVRVIVACTDTGTDTHADTHVDINTVTAPQAQMQSPTPTPTQAPAQTQTQAQTHHSSCHGPPRKSGSSPGTRPVGAKRLHSPCTSLQTNTTYIGL